MFLCFFYYLIYNMNMVSYCKTLSQSCTALLIAVCLWRLWFFPLLPLNLFLPLLMWCLWACNLLFYGGLLSLALPLYPLFPRILGPLRLFILIFSISVISLISNFLPYSICSFVIPSVPADKSLPLSLPRRLIFPIFLTLLYFYPVFFLFCLQFCTSMVIYSFS